MRTGYGARRAYPDERWPTTGDQAEPLPGPTLRARVGDIVQISLLNEVDAAWFGLTYDRGEQGLGCDESMGPDGQIYPGNTRDIMPNCFHGSSTSNLHFHGTHTSPSTASDKVMLWARVNIEAMPSTRQKFAAPASSANRNSKWS